MLLKLYNLLRHFITHPFLREKYQPVETICSIILSVKAREVPIQPQRQKFTEFTVVAMISALDSGTACTIANRRQTQTRLTSCGKKLEQFCHPSLQPLLHKVAHTFWCDTVNYGNSDTPKTRGGAWWGMIACMLRDASRAKKSINWHERTKHENVRCISLTWQKIAWELKPKKNPKHILRRINETSCRGSDRRYTLKLPILPILLGCCIFWESSAAASQFTALEQHQGSPWKTRRQFTHKICDPESFKWCKSAESTNGLGLAYMSSVTRPASSKYITELDKAAQHLWKVVRSSWML